MQSFQMINWKDCCFYLLQIDSPTICYRVIATICHTIQSMIAMVWPTTGVSLWTSFKDIIKELMNSLWPSVLYFSIFHVLTTWQVCTTDFKIIDLMKWCKWYKLLVADTNKHYQQETTHGKLLSSFNVGISYKSCY